MSDARPTIVAVTGASGAPYAVRLLEALADYGGTLIFVSHDRYFVDRLANKIVSVGKGGIEVYPGTYEQFLWSRTAHDGRVYDNRHTRLTKWLNDGVPPAQVAEWAGNSVPVLLATYARCVDGQLPDLKRRLEAAGDLPDVSGAG